MPFTEFNLYARNKYLNIDNIISIIDNYLLNVYNIQD